MFRRSNKKNIFCGYPHRNFFILGGVVVLMIKDDEVTIGSKEEAYWSEKLERAETNIFECERIIEVESVVASYCKAKLDELSEEVTA